MRKRTAVKRKTTFSVRSRLKGNGFVITVTGPKRLQYVDYSLIRYRLQYVDSF